MNRSMILTSKSFLLDLNILKPLSEYFVYNHIL